MSIQQGDIVLFQSVNDGEIEVINGLITMNGGLQTTVYLSLFGGNQYGKQEPESNNYKEWWGNIGEVEENQYISKTQNFIEGMPLITSNLNALEEAAKEDLKWLIDKKIATKIIVNVSIPNLNMVKLEIEINNEKFEFLANWRNN